MWFNDLGCMFWELMANAASIKKTQNMKGRVGERDTKLRGKRG